MVLLGLEDRSDVVEFLFELVPHTLALQVVRYRDELVNVLIQDALVLLVNRETPLEMLREHAQPDPLEFLLL